MLFGGYGSDLLNGGAGNDTLNGGADLDQLWGGTGKDRFEFSDFNIIDWAADSVNDFAKGDTIVFSQGLADDYGFNVLKGKLDKNSFVSGASAQAHDADDRFIYDTSSHTLWFDPDGDAGQAAVEVATFANNYSLTAADIAFV
ncbi:MAG: calcium-binding protein [Hyphomicrobiales bacterium]